MESLQILRLNLLAPLVYTRDDPPEPPGFSGSQGLPTGGEWLFCFELDGAQALSIEPERERYPGTLVFRGKGGPAAGPPVELPAGRYFFAQARRALPWGEIVSMAVEVQKEALWEREVPETRFYLRCLSEDGAFVTQVFRPV